MISQMQSEEAKWKTGIKLWDPSQIAGIVGLCCSKFVTDIDTWHFLTQYVLIARARVARTVTH